MALAGAAALSASVAAAAAGDTQTFTSGQVGTSGQTAQFSEVGNWQLAWSYDCSSFGSKGNFSVTINEPAGDVAGDVGPNELGMSGSGTDYYGDSGTFSLTVDSECNWTITVSPNSGSPAVGTTSFSSATTGSSGETLPFTESGSWQMAWSYDCTSWGSKGNFSVTVNQPAADTMADVGPNELGTGGSGTDHYTDAGTFSLTVLSECTWAITVSPEAAASPPPSPNPTVTGYDLVGSDGGVFVFGGSGGYYGSLPGLGIHVNNIVGIVPSPGYAGYLLVGSDGGVFAFGNAQYYGSLPGLGVKPAQPIAGIVPTSDGHGYFLVGKDGGVFGFGDAQFEGSLPGAGIQTTDVTSIASTPDDRGYWVLLGSGQVNNFGDAPNLVGAANSAGPLPNLEPYITYNHIASTESGQGYWVLDSAGSVHPYGDAGLFGGASAQALSGETPISLVPTGDSQGYWIVTSNGDVAADGDANSYGSLKQMGIAPSQPIVGAVPT